ncbi:MAG: outer membrane protein transport protein [Sphingomonadales bacterium]|nr:outer membrane protein transport protein [Sphingomonadales bacterium]
MTALIGTAVASVIVPSAAQATEGYFLNGTSVRDKGVAGAGIADPQDPLVLANNPAGIAEIDSQVEIGVSVFMPRRDYTGSGGPGFTGSGSVNSGSKFFVLPAMAVSYKLDENSAVGLAIYGNGGLNTNYPDISNPACASPPFPASSGTYCAGSAGVNLIQGFVSAGYARKLGDHVTIGVAPVFAMQIFQSRGIATFSAFSVDPTHFSNNGNSTSTGIGVRGGVLIKVNDGFRLAGSYQSKINMSKFDKYSGLFENGGDFDIPSNFQIGMAIDAGENITLMADYRHIEYSDVPAVSNASNIQLPFGAPGGPGFGWDNVDVVKFGIESEVSDKLTLRAGAAFNNNPVPRADATLNILAPGVSKQHFTAGARLKMGETSALDFSFLYSPPAHTIGIEVTPQGPNPTHQIDLQMHQFEVGVAWSKKL